MLLILLLTSSLPVLILKGMKVSIAQLPPKPPKPDAMVAVRVVTLELHVESHKKMLATAM